MSWPRRGPGQSHSLAPTCGSLHGHCFQTSPPRPFLCSGCSRRVAQTLDSERMEFSGPEEREIGKVREESLKTQAHFSAGHWPHVGVPGGPFASSSG